MLTPVTASVEHGLLGALNIRFCVASFVIEAISVAFHSAEAQDSVCYMYVTLPSANTQYRSVSTHLSLRTGLGVQDSGPCFLLLCPVSHFCADLVHCCWHTDGEPMGIEDYTAYTVDYTKLRGKCPRILLLDLPLHSLGQDTYLLIKLK